MPEMPGSPRDGDGDGYIADGTPQMRPAPPRGAEPPSNAHLYPGVPAGVSVRRPGDAATIRTNTYARVEEAARSIQPVANVRHSIELSDVGWEGPASYTPSQVKQAKLEGRSLVRRLRGTWLLKDATDGRVVDAKRSTIAAVPIMNDDGSYTIGGTNYFLPGAQLRLKPGVYTRKKANGEFESHINALPGQGRAFRIFLEPDTGKMRVEVGQSATPLINMLKALGVKDAEVRSTLGDELAAINLATADSKALDRLHARMVPRGKESSPDGKAREIAEVLKATKLDPGVTAHTLGHPFETVDGAAVLAAAAKLKAVSRGEAPPDDRDHLAYMTAYGPEDLISERLRLVRAPLIRGLWKASREGSLRAFPNDVLGPAARGAILSSGIGQAGESINPLMDLDNRHRATRLGEGGIESADSVPVESRAVQPSHLMYIDPLVSPECYSDRTEVLTSVGWLSWPEVDAKTQFAICDGIKRFRYCIADKLMVYRYSGDMYGVDHPETSYLVTPNHRVMTFDPVGMGFDDEPTPAADLYGRSFSLVGNCNTYGLKTFDIAPEHHRRVPYDGVVYCASVPGGRLYVRSPRPDGSMGEGHWSGNSLKIGVDARFAGKTLVGSDHKLYSPFRDVQTGQVRYMAPDQIADSAVAFPGELESGEPYVRALYRGKQTFVPRQQVRFVPTDMESAFTHITNLVPMKSTVKGQRAVMAGRMLTQSLPLKDPESALVQSGVPGSLDDSFDRRLGGDMGAIHADGPARVRAVGEDYIDLDTQQGRKRINLRINDPSNRKTLVHQTPVVQPGDQVQQGQLLARSNYTDEHGTLALGKNLRVAYVPAFDNYEDAYSISESAARRLTSEHAYQHTLDLGDGVQHGKGRYTSVFPAKFNRRQLETLDDDGVVTKGTVVNPGDPLVLATRDKAPSFASLHSARKVSFDDAAEIWEHESEGIVTDVAKTPTGVNVLVKAYSPMQVGDKLCYSEDTEALTSQGWKPIFDVTEDDKVASLASDGTIEYLNPAAIQKFHHVGRMYNLETTQASLLVTDNHHLYAQTREGRDGYLDNYRLIEARDLYGKRYRLKRDGDWEGVDPGYVRLPAVETKAGQGGRGSRVIPALDVPAKTYAMLLGMFLSEGNVFDSGPKGQGFDITQIKPATRRRMLEALDKAGVKYSTSETKIRVFGTQWFRHFRQFGKCWEKFIPPEVFDWDVETLKVLYEWLMWGDGSTGGTGHVYHTTSPRLADDVQRLALHIGYSANIDVHPPKRGMIKGKEYDFRARYWVSIFRSKNRPEINHSHAKKQGGQLEQWVDYDATVHCVTLPRNHVLYVRRNGKPVWCGNSGRMGDKGVISRIVPDHQMPHDSEGRPFEVLANPLGLLTRTNSAQVFEAALGKIAEKTGRPYRVQDFGGIRDMREFVKAELNKYGMKATDTIVDPTNGRKIPRVLAGNRYFLKLHHQSEGKLGGRGTGGYTAEGMPAKGGFGGAKRVSLLSCNALLSHGACFMGSANVLTEDGHLEIAKIVKKRMPVKVACIDMKTGEMVYRPVIDWLCRCVPTSELIKIETNARVEGFRQSRSGHRAIRCTRGHEFYTPGGKVHAGNLKPGDVVYTLGTRLADWQEQFIVGTLLGDGSLTCSEERISGLSQVHGAPQLLYLRWKFAKLRNIANKEPKLGKLSVGGFAKVPTTRFCTRQHPTLDRLGEEFYGSGVKKPPVGIVARAGWLGIGVWFGDDGGCVFSNKLGAITGFRFHTNGFTYDEAETLAQELRDFCGLPWRVIMQNGKYPILHLGKTGGPTDDNLARWSEMLRPYLPPDMAYKLRVDSCGEVWNDLQPPEGVFLEETTVKSVEPYTPEPYENNLVYNITVAEHHNYVVHGIVVGNTAVLRDAGAFRGQAHADFWTRFMAGHDLPDPQSPMVYDKFFAQLKGAGINVTRDGPKLRLLALTDHDVNELAGDRELQNPETVDWKGGLKPVKGGLFDEGLTGGHGAKGRWAKITLAEPMVSPAFEEPVRRILGLTQQGFKDVVAGRKSLDNLGSGPGAIQAALGRINLDKAINACRADIKSGRKTRRDEAARKIGYLLSAQKLGLHPKDWVLSAVPVLPPAFRPVSVMQGSGIPMVADPNLLYRELWDANENLKSLKGRVDDVSGEREALYNAFKGVVGLGDPIHPKNQEKKVKGLLAHVFGNTPKRSVLQRKLIGATTDLVGRAVISPDPALDMDEVALPENSAWEMYRPFVVRRLVRQGMGHIDAVRAHERRDDRAKKALLAEMDQRPVMVDRAPVLHRYSMMALRPKLTHDNVMKLSPPIVKGFGADFDGDCHHSNVVLTVANDDISRILESCGLTSQDFKDRLVPYSDDTTIPSIRNGNLYLFHLEDFPHGDFFKTTQGQFGPIDWYSVPPGIKVLAQLPNGTLAWSDVSVWSVHRDCEVEIVTLNTGVQIFTDDDPRAVYGIAAGTLELARATPTEAHEQLFLVPRVVRIQDALRSPWDDAPTSRGVTHLGIGRRRLNEEILLDHESGYLIGAMAGNGWGDGRHACLAATDDNVGDKFETCVQRWFVGEAPPRSTRERHADEKGGYGRNRKHTYSSSDLSDLVESCVGHGARNKHLPSWFLNTPREFREGLFAGLMDTDGGVSISHAKKNPQLMVSYTSTSLRLCQEIRLLAASLGIRGSVRSAPTPAGKSGWIVLFSNYDASKWGGKGTVHSTRTAALKSIVVGETPALVRYDLVPISFNLAKACQSSMTYPKDPKKRPPGRQAIYSAFHLATKKGYVTRQSAVRLLDHIDPARRDVLVNHPQWAFWRSIVDNTDVTWDQIESVERTNQTVTGYDLTVPGAETFADADGTILSNTMQFHVPVSDDAAREMLEKMLPSRNLFSPSTFAVHQLPNNEFAGGLYQASTDQAPGEPRQFASRADAMRAYRRGEINYNTPIRILGS